MDVLVTQGRGADRPACRIGLFGIAFRYATVVLFVAGATFVPGARAQDASPSTLGQQHFAQVTAIPRNHAR